MSKQKKTDRKTKQNEFSFQLNFQLSFVGKALSMNGISRLFFLWNSRSFSFVPQDKNKITKPSFSSQSASTQSWVSLENFRLNKFFISVSRRSAILFPTINVRLAAYLMPFSTLKGLRERLPCFYRDGVLNLRARATREKREKAENLWDFSLPVSLVSRVIIIFMTQPSHSNSEKRKNFLLRDEQALRKWITSSESSAFEGKRNFKTPSGCSRKRSSAVQMRGKRCVERVEASSFMTEMKSVLFSHFSPLLEMCAT